MKLISYACQKIYKYIDLFAYELIIYFVMEKEITLPSEIKCLNHLIMKRIDKYLETEGLTPQQALILMFIQKNYGKIKQNDICNKFGLSKSTVSGLVKRTIENGLIERNNGYLVMTQKGKNIKGILERAEKNVEKEILENITDEEKNTLIKLINKIKENMGGNNS